MNLRGNSITLTWVYTKTPTWELISTVRWVHTNTLMWELIGKDKGLTWVYTNTLTWELIGPVTWVYTNTLTWELNRYRRRTTTTTHFKSFQSIDKPIGASPGRDYDVRSEEDGISTNRII